MNKTTIKSILRSIKSSLGRFAAIFAISALGVGFLAGLLAATPDMADSGSRYFDENALADLRLLSNVGLDEDDLAALRQTPGIRDAQGLRTADLLFENQEGVTLALKVYGVPDADPLAGQINKLTLSEGRLPENPGECLAESTVSAVKTVRVGDTLTFSAQNSQSAGEDFTGRTLTVVGLVENPYYMAMAREQTTIGRGSISEVIYVCQSLFDIDYYTEIMAVFEGTTGLVSLSDAYDDAAQPVLDAVEGLAETQKYHRHDKVVGEAREKIDEAWDTYNQKKAEADAEFQKAGDQIEKAERDIREGRQTLAEKEADGRREIAENEEKLRDAYAQLQEGEADLRQGLSDWQEGLRQYEEGRVDYEDGLAKWQEGLQKYEEGRADYEDGLRQYEAGLADYEDGKAEYEEGLQAYQEGKKAYDDGVDAWLEGSRQLQAAQAQIDAGRTALTEAEAQLEAGQQELDAQAVQAGEMLSMFIPGVEIHSANDLLALADSNRGVAVLLRNVLPQLREAQTQIDEGRAEIAENRVLLAAGQREVDAGFSALADSDAQLRSARRQLLDAWLTLEDGRRELEDAEAQLRDAEAELIDGKAELEDAEAELKDGKAELDDAWQTLEDARLELENGKQELDDARQTLDDGWADYREGAAKLADGKRELEKGIAQAKADIAKGEDDLARGRQEYLDAKAEADRKLEDAQLEILDAENKLKDLDTPKWYVLSRNEMITPAGFEANIEKVASIARVFPVFFFLIAALVCLTTMTRMVEEERGVIGTMKALGYGPMTIAAKYLLYAFIAAFCGSAVGLALGFSIFPRIIWNAYAIMYRLPPLSTPFRWNYALLAAGATIACTLGATGWVCLESMREVPAALMLPKAPKAGKRVFLERIPFLWKRLSFNYKVTVRNLFRYKKRFFMTVFGVAGCTALLVTGFGLRDSIGDILQNQFETLWQFDLTVGVKPVDETPLDPAITRLMEGAGAHMLVRQESGKVQKDDSPVSEVVLFVPETAADFDRFVLLRDRVSGTPVEFGPDAVVLTEKAAMTIGASKGDTITVRDGDGQEAQVQITGITENYIRGYLYLAPDVYTSLFDTQPTGNTLICCTGGLEEDARAALAEKILRCPSATSVTFTQDTARDFSDTFKSIDMIVVVLIICAGMLAFVVLYNLTNINITERQKEIATLKVLGFFENEVSAYVLRETNFLTLFGAAAGMVLGKYLHAFVARTAEVDMVMFGRVILPRSYLFSLVLTVFFSLCVSLVMNGKLRRISMVESMKAPE